MTRRTFYRRLRKLHHQGWRVLPFGELRNRGGQCPICAVLNSRHKLRAQSANAEAGEPLSYDDVCRITKAADWAVPATRRTRRALLRAVGLKEVE